MTEQLENTPGGAPVRGPRSLIFEIGSSESRCVEAAPLDVALAPLDSWLDDQVRDQAPALPHVTEVEIARHYAHLASMNFGVDTGSYPLGSCTMKYNPRINEDACRLEGFAGLHPYQLSDTVQGALELMVGLAEALGEISGLPGVTLQPAAGAHGELTALLIFRAWHIANGDPRRRVIIPDTAHGTNPATVAMCGYEVTTIPSNERGGADTGALEAALDTDVAALMLTNPNTLGLFEENILAITEAVHRVGALAYCDGANMNAIMGKARPGDMGFDALHINLHKTFSTPHGGGGPGAGPVCVTDALTPYLPGPVPVRLDDATYALIEPERSIGRVRGFLGNFGVLVRAYAYVRALGAAGLRETSEQAVLSANYLKEQLKDVYDLPYDRICMHEFVLSGGRQKRENGVRTLDIAKRLLDYGAHPPTIYFPLIVDEALMIEPTETESPADLDRFAAAMRAIAEEAASNPDLVKGAPYTTPVRRLDEAGAARNPNLRWTPREPSAGE
ncbi:MAG: aminomethyl-transferring glycine dehydrogenase subunit GcvPB [Actinomycetota bacterium]|nr:aminomethyl-transferring glycine dehydrogenase subunit GcvPB [Actinomycetota bacterium]